MIYIGNNEISNIYIGTDEIYGIYAGDLQIYPTDFGNVTAITISGLTWVTDVPASGGTADSGNCSFDVIAFYDSGKKKRVTNYATVTGSLVVSATTAETRENVGTLTLTASYSGFTDSDTVDVYQKAKNYNNVLVYTTTDGNALSRDFSQYAWSQNYVSHTYTGGEGVIQFDDDITAIPDNVFSGCTTLQTIKVPNSVATYGSKTFYDCSGVTKINIPSAVTSIGSECFHMTSGELTIESQYAVSGTGKGDINSYTDNDGVGFNKKFCGSSFDAMNFDKIIVTGDSVTYIGKAAFHSSPATEFVFGDSITTFGGMCLARLNGGVQRKLCQKVTFGSNVEWFAVYLFFVGASYVTEINCHTTTCPQVGNSWSFSDLNGNNGTFHYPSNGTGYSGSVFNLTSWNFVNDL